MTVGPKRWTYLVPALSLIVIIVIPTCGVPGGIWTQGRRDSLVSLPCRHLTCVATSTNTSTNAYLSLLPLCTFLTAPFSKHTHTHILNIRSAYPRVNGNAYPTASISGMRMRHPN
jgi:hypothetical protein